MTELFMVRHAHDLRAASSGRPLSRLGRDQAVAVGRWLRDAEIGALWTAPSRRARQTAGAIGKALGVPARQDARLDEIRNDHGPTAGIAPPRERAHPMCIPGVEEWDAFLLRVASFFSELCASAPAERIAVVTHSGVFDALHEVLTGAGRRVELDIAHTGISVWRHRPGSAGGAWLLRWHNRVEHLPVDLRTGMAPSLEGAC